jgi:hypothetical protein
MFRDARIWWQRSAWSGILNSVIGSRALSRKHFDEVLQMFKACLGLGLADTVAL